ncbi:MAG: DHA2 family efflux MFS transporter permease subunit [Burkholderiales bacterium]|nr:DHA2 family efflux MFS transporter permease subunit [Burkholderiales bacterium]
MKDKKIAVMNNKVNFWLQDRTIIALALSLMALAEIIDLTIVAVALPNIMGSLSANLDEISLTITSYIVAAAIFIPLTGFVTNKFGVKRVALVSAFLFGVSSILCGMATSLPEMICFRLLQGVGGAFMPSLVQGYIADNFEGAELEKMMAVFSSCVVLGPIIGPVMGGGIAEDMNWRWIFYVNVPICIVSFGVIQFLMDDVEVKPIKADYTSFLFMALGVGCLEFFFDEGNSHNWLESNMLIIVLVSSVLFITFFIWRGILGKSVVNFELFRQRNFMLSCLCVFIFMILMAGILNFFPTLLQQGYGFPVDTAGYITAPRGIAAFISAPIFIKLGRKIDARMLMVIGIMVFTISGFMLCLYSVEHNKMLIIITGMIQGAGMMGFFVNIMQLAYTNLPTALNSDASGIFNFFRNIGSSIGTSIGSTIISHQQQVAWHDLAGHISQHSTLYQNIAAKLPNGAHAIQITASWVQQQAFFIANLDVFYYAMLGSMVLFFFPFFLDKPDKNRSFVME